MAEHAGDDEGEVAAGDMEVGMADAAGGDADADLSVLGLGAGDVFDAERGPDGRQDGGAH
jgi:hypothetical protein